MSSTLLYLAIVAVWAVVLVPMYLRRDTDSTNAGISRLLHRRSGLPETIADDLGSDQDTMATHGSLEPAEDALGYGEGDGLDEEADEAETADERAVRRLRRATVIARRRRRTFLLTVAVLAAAVVVAAGLAPWWVALPPVGMFVFHLALLRVAVGMDATQHERVVLVRTQARVKARAAEQTRLAEEAARAEIIDLAERAKARDVFDQYARDEGGEGDVARAVGD